MIHFIFFFRIWVRLFIQLPFSKMLFVVILDRLVKSVCVYSNEGILFIEYSLSYTLHLKMDTVLNY